MKWHLSGRTRGMNPSVLRELLKLTETPGLISLAGGVPSPQTFPVEAFAAACDHVLRKDGRAALQYAASEGYGPLREMVAASLPWPVKPDEVLITTGSQQGLDLLAKVLIDPGSRVAVETPTYLGALQAFSVFEPAFVSIANKAGGLDLDELSSRASGARFLYVLPNYQNPTGRTMSPGSRIELVDRAMSMNLPIIEDNPYGELWFDNPPPPPLTPLNTEGCVYLGSLSKILAPGLRLGFIVAPAALRAKLLQAKQAADLHTPGFNQRLAVQVMQGGFMEAHGPRLRSLYRSQRDAMLDALVRHMGDLNVRWNCPAGGMFLWLRLPEGLDATALLAPAIARGMAFVPGHAFFAQAADHRCLRLSFATASATEIERAIAALASVVRDSTSGSATPPTFPSRPPEVALKELP